LILITVIKIVVVYQWGLGAVVVAVVVLLRSMRSSFRIGYLDDLIRQHPKHCAGSGGSRGTFGHGPRSPIQFGYRLWPPPTKKSTWDTGKHINFPPSRSATCANDVVPLLAGCLDTPVCVGPWHILSRIYNCTKHGNRPIDNATTAHFTLHISILQLHKLGTTAR